MNSNARKKLEEFYGKKPDPVVGNQELEISGTTLSITGGNSVEVPTSIGPKGPTGDQGSDGAEGPEGPQGSEGPAGLTNVLDQCRSSEGHDRTFRYVWNVRQDPRFLRTVWKVRKFRVRKVQWSGSSCSPAVPDILPDLPDLADGPQGLVIQPNRPNLVPV